MGWRIVKQPNGRLARFSEVCDDFTDMDMTEDEAVECCREYMGRREAGEKVAMGMADSPIGRGRWPRTDDGLDRWRDALRIIGTVHGPDVRREREAVGNGTPSDLE